MTDILDLLRLVVGRGASDLHLKVPGPPVLRIHGALVPLEGAPSMTPDITESFFRAITTPEQRARFAEQRELDLAYSVPGLARFRVNVFRQRGSIGLAIRAVPLALRRIDELGLPDICRRLALLPRGLVLVTGPSGSGKSTTLAAMVDYLNDRETRHVVTVEDPIEFLHRDKRCVIAQREVGEDTHSFAAALRHVLRQDPDVILVGEMRDLETIAIAVTAAETGHLVLATLHTTSAHQTIDRIVDVFPAGQQEQIRAQLALTLEAVITQALLPTADGTGRVAACEVLIGTAAVRNLIREGKTFQIPSTMQVSGQAGMQTLAQSLVQLVRGRAITRETALSHCSNPEELGRLLSSDFTIVRG